MRNTNCYPGKVVGMLSAEEADIYVESDEAPNAGDQ